MSKHFLEAFPTLQWDGAMSSLLEHVSVEKVTVSKNRDTMRIYILSDRLIQKNVIFDMESSIQKQQ